jgi:hypothetical protein
VVLPNTLRLVGSYGFLYMPTHFIEWSRAIVAVGKSDIATMQEVLNRGLWDDPLMDPET